MATRRQHLTYLVYRAAAAVLGALPRSCSGALGSVGGWLAAAMSPTQRAVVRANLSHIVGNGDAAALDALVRRSFMSYGRYWADAARLSPRDARRRRSLITVVGREHFDDARRRGGVLFALPHIGLWDAGGLFALEEGFRMSTVAEPAESLELFGWFVKRRAQLGIDALAPGRDATAQLLTSLRAGGIVALVADRDVLGDGIEVDFFGQPARVPPGPSLLAIRSGAALLPSAVYQDDAHRYRIEFRAPLDTSRHASLREDMERVTKTLVHEFEDLILRAPEQWHVFQPNWPERPGSADSRASC